MSAYKLFFSPLALTDIRDARVWYEQQQKGLGTKFIADVKQTFISIKSNPQFASIKFDNIRSAACKNFPYAVHYEIDEQEKIVRIISIFHFSRRPYWLK
jgi:toxin ParE1/3/4